MLRVCAREWWVMGEEDIHVCVQNVRCHEATLLELGDHLFRHLKQVQTGPLGALCKERMHFV